MNEVNLSKQSKSIILIVDDEPTNIAVLGNLLLPYYTVLVANSASVALQIIDNPDPNPDLILLDIMMPVVNGYELLSSLKTNPNTANIPVILITALDSESDEKHGLELGAVDFIGKPFNPVTLLARIATHLELKNARDALANQNAMLESELNRRLQENQQIQRQLLQSEKMAAIGQLSAGIVHEINNPIGFVNSNLNTLNQYASQIFQLLEAYETIIESHPDPLAITKMHGLQVENKLNFMREDIPELIDESLEGLSRVRTIIQDLKGFSHQDNEIWEQADIHKCLDSTLNIIWNEVKYNCTIIKHYGEIPMLYCLPAQLNQVFMNLLVNAAQAITGKGEITIATGYEASEVWVSISDTGQGISAEHLSRLFDPFFTTKPVGKGTGLGLSISLSIVQKHAGRIEVESELGKGSCFRIYLPVTVDSDGSAAT